jgi:RNA polymerase sigma factor (sigma-70 family)
MSEPSDEALIQAWCEGDQCAGEQLFRRYRTPIIRFFMRRISGNVDDLVQTTFLGLVENAQRFHGTNFRAYLYGIARNTLLKHLRKAGRASHVDPDNETLAALDPSWTMLRAAHEDEKLLAAALRQLPINTQILLELRYWESMSIKELAELLEIEAGAVKVRLHRGRKRLEKELEQLAQSPRELRSSLYRISKWAQDVRHGQTPDER